MHAPVATPVITIEPRSVEILDSIKSVVANKGFDGASMQDLARAAGMSAGNFYRYFPSKEAILAAFVERELHEIQGKFGFVINSAMPLETFCQILRHRIETDDEDEGRIWAEIQATASRRPEIAALMQRMEDEITGYIIAVLGQIGHVDPATARDRYMAHALLIMTLVHALSLPACGSQQRAGSDANRKLQALAVAMIERMLAEIAADAAPAPITQAKA